MEGGGGIILCQKFIFVTTVPDTKEHQQDLTGQATRGATGTMTKLRNNNGFLVSKVFDFNAALDWLACKKSNSINRSFVLVSSCHFIVFLLALVFPKSVRS